MSKISTRLTDGKLDLSQLVMPNNKRLGDCTFAEFNKFKIRDLVAAHSDLAFWYQLSKDDFPCKAKPKKATPPVLKRKPSHPSGVRFIDGRSMSASAAGFISEDEDENPRGVMRH
jgi:hypothetical protein